MNILKLRRATKYTRALIKRYLNSLVKGQPETFLTEKKCPDVVRAKAGSPEWKKAIEEGKVVIAEDFLPRYSPPKKRTWNISPERQWKIDCNVMEVRLYFGPESVEAHIEGYDYTEEEKEYARSLG